MKTFPASNGASQVSASVPIPEAEVRDQLNRILASPGFRGSERIQRFLRFAVERTLAGESGQIKESIVGREVFDRGPDYNPTQDSIVRVEAQRLRKKLREYYKTSGSADPILITLDAGSYVPAFARVTPARLASIHVLPEVAPKKPDPRTVAVLPFLNLSPEPEQDYFCDGIAEDIISQLSSIPELRVIGRTSMFTLKGASPDLRAIGAHWGAGTIIEGTLRKEGELLRVSARIIDAETEQARWSQVFDRKIGDVFSIEDEIAHAIADTLRLTPPSAGPGQKPVSTEAYVLYLKGRQAWSQLSQAGFQSAIKYFTRAISLYPGYAAPYAGLADTYTWLAMWGLMRPKDVWPQGKAAAVEALRLDPASAQARASLGATMFFLDWKFQEGLALVNSAIHSEPSYLDGHHLYGACLLILGRFEEALLHLERTVQLDPLSFRMNRTLGVFYYFHGRADEAEKWLQTAAALQPDSMECRYVLARVHVQQRRYDAALNEARKCQALQPGAMAEGILGVILARNGDPEGARRCLERLSEMSSSRWVDPVLSAYIHVALNNFDAALECLGKSLDARSPHALFLNVDPSFDDLRSDVRFQNLVASLKFPRA